MSNRSHNKSIFARAIASFHKSRRFRFALSAVWLVSLLGLGIYFELFQEHQQSGGPCALVEHDQTETSAATYARLVSNDYRDVRSRRVTVIPISDETDPAKVLNNVCEQRWYIGKLLQQLSTAGASVVVIDKFFGPNSCDKEDIGTAELAIGIRDLKTPLVIGTATHAAKTASEGSCLIQTPSLELGQHAKPQKPENSRVIVALTRLNADVRKVPLEWSVYANDEAAQKNIGPGQLDTVSYITALLADEHLKNDHRLQDLRTSGQHPFTSFIDPDSLPRMDALTYLCSGPYRIEIETRYAIRCADHAPVDLDMRKRVVIIGEDSSSRDRHRLFERDVSGLYLQANYIEALLDGRYFKPLPKMWDFGLLVGWLLFTYAIFWAPIAPEWSLAIAAVVGLVMFRGILQVVIWTGYYPDLGAQAVGAVALLLRYIEVRGHHLAESLSERKTHSKHNRSPAGEAK